MPENQHRETFCRDERLKSRKIIKLLMEEGRHLSAFPLRLVWKITEVPSSYPAQVAFAVPKKNFALAVDRNRLKRQMRELYRKNKSPLYSLLQQGEKTAALLLIFSGKEKAEYAILEKKYHQLLTQLEEHLKKNI